MARNHRRVGQLWTSVVLIFLLLPQQSLGQSADEEWMALQQYIESEYVIWLDDLPRLSDRQEDLEINAAILYGYAIRDVMLDTKNVSERIRIVDLLNSRLSSILERMATSGIYTQKELLQVANQALYGIKDQEARDIVARMSGIIPDDPPDYFEWRRIDTDPPPTKMSTQNTARMGLVDPRQPASDGGEEEEQRRKVVAPERDLSGFADISPWQSFLSAIGNDDYEELRMLLEGGVDPNVADPFSGLTPLMIAESIPMVDLLIRSGADVRTADSKGATALHHAIFSRDAIPIVYRLLQERPDVDKPAPGDGNQTPLLLCRQLFFEGNDHETGIRLINILSDAGASVNAWDDSGYTLLKTAALNNKIDLAETALDLGADPLLEIDGGETAVDIAKKHSPRVFRILSRQ